MEAHFGSRAAYWRICRGIDEREVKPDRPYKSVSAERTFDVDYSDPDDLRRELTRVAGYAWKRIERSEVTGRTVTLKVKFADFTMITRSRSFALPVADQAAFEAAGQALLDVLLPACRRAFDCSAWAFIRSIERTDEPVQLDSKFEYFLLYNCHIGRRDPAAVASYRIIIHIAKEPRPGGRFWGRYGCVGTV